jgi:hypothetical protein
MYDRGLYGQPTEPRRFPEDVLLQKEAGQTKSSWKLQMMLDTTLSDQDRYPLKLKDLMVISTDSLKAPMTIVWSGLEKHRATGIPLCGFTGDYLVNPMFTSDDWRTYEKKYLVVDPSGQGTDETSWVVFGTLAGRYFVLDFGGTTDGYGESTLDLLTQKAMEHRVNEVVYENNFGDGMFGVILGQYMKLKYPVGITPVKAKGQKEWEDLKARVFSGGATDDSNDVLALQGQNARKAGFGIGMGLAYEDLRDPKVLKNK